VRLLAVAGGLYHAQYHWVTESGDTIFAQDDFLTTFPTSDSLRPWFMWFAEDSPLEGTGFEPSVPRQEKWSRPSSSDQTRVGRPLTLGGGAESSLEGSDIELSVSPKDILLRPMIST
jgi:hypothetical protein